MTQGQGDQVQFGNAGEELKKILESKSYSSVHVLCDENTHRHCLPKLEAKLDLIDLHVITILSGEEHKTLASCEKVWSQLSSQGADRNSLLVNLGGGVVTDLGGFCAASFMRGMYFVHVPTSILGMTDAAIGGKTGVDFKTFKNYIGFFAEPVEVIVDVSFIATLDMRQRRNGLAEVLKHGFIHDPGLVDEVIAFGKLKDIDWDVVLRRSVLTKIELIENDRFDRGMRAALNFGHTVGHAIESCSLMTEKPLHHGEAIALGMLVEGRISHQISGLGAEELDSLENVIEHYFTEVQFPPVSLDQLHALIRKDKKKHGDDVLYSLIKALGVPAIGQKVPENALNEAYLHYAKR